MAELDPTDFLQRATLEQAPIRLHVVRLEQALRDGLSQGAYPEAVRGCLSEMMALTAVLADNIKFDGIVSLQARGNGPDPASGPRLLLAECSRQTDLRAVSRGAIDNAKPRPAMNDMLGNKGQMALSLIGQTGTVSQAIVETGHGTLTECIEHYFAQSEQIPTRIRLVTRTGPAPAVLAVVLQRLPPPERSTALDLDTIDAAWEQLREDFRQSDDGDWLSLSSEALLRRLFGRRWMRLLPPRPLRFACSCNENRSATALRALSLEDSLALLREQGTIQVTCEFCGTVYRYDEIDVYALHQAGAGSDQLH